MKERVLSIFNSDFSEAHGNNIGQGMDRCNNTMYNIMKIIVGVFLTAALLAGTIHFVDPGNALYKTEPFYTRASEYDILFMGNSHMAMAIAPMELWQDYGIRAYNLANQNQPIIASYWQLKEALEYANPKVVVIDVFGLEANVRYGDTNWRLHWAHNLFDNMHNQDLKLQAMEDLLSPEDYEEFRFPFSSYHNRWKNIDKVFWDREHLNSEKGGELDAAYIMGSAGTQSVEKPVLLTPGDYNSVITDNTIGAQYLEKMIELCQEKEIEVLLTAVPFSADDSRQRNINAAHIIAYRYNVPFLNMFYMDIPLNWDTDFMDWGHLNSSGMRKVTDVLGKYLIEHYSVQVLDDSEEPAQLEMAWDSDYEAYLSYKIEWLKGQEELKSYLMLLFDDDYQIVMVVEGSPLFSDKDTIPYFKNLGMEEFIEPIEKLENEYGSMESVEGLNGFMIGIEFCDKKPCATIMSETDFHNLIGNLDEETIHLSGNGQSSGTFGLYVFRTDSKELVDMRWF